jgi:hypothetical protein
MAMAVSTRSHSFAGYYVGTILRPQRTFEALLADKRRLLLGLLALAVNAFLYTLVYVFLTMGGGAPLAIHPWLAIPTDLYYFYNQFMLAPSLLMCWLLAGGVAQLLSRFFGGKGTFEDTLSLLGFAISVACLASLLHDLPDSFLGAIGLLDLRQYEVALNSPTLWRAILLTLYSIYLLWFIVLFTKAVAVAQRIRLSQALVVGLVTFAVYQGVFFIFNR